MIDINPIVYHPDPVPLDIPPFRLSRDEFGNSDNRFRSLKVVRDALKNGDSEVIYNGNTEESCGYDDGHTGRRIDVDYVRFYSSQGRERKEKVLQRIRRKVSVRNNHL